MTYDHGFQLIVFSDNKEVVFLLLGIEDLQNTRCDHEHCFFASCFDIVYLYEIQLMRTGKQNHMYLFVFLLFC